MTKTKKQNTQKFRQEYIENVKKQSFCKDCGEKNYIVLEFDHVKEPKLFDLGNGKSHTIDEIDAEIKKTTVRCSNCHRIVTYLERQGLEVSWKKEGLLATVAWG